ncbi:MAG TPA: adenosyl-hopene transferase HpnH [Anaerolineae bacterium]|nr:adenosyl-hopene transferase HpnH [Anaerolineae bacterium]HOQ97629.1 adenosyl-hopene transferase HpnH [Anaerolineae bacterium]HPL27827.1 adenosyl-hopene transferase HpnH [Anaerolineae bacterium]
MIFPWQLSLSLGRHIAAHRLQGRKRFPLVLMLEPTLRCNLACAGCGRIREEKETGGRMLSAAECLAAVDEAGAPIVSVTGGEPLLHPQVGEIIRGITARRRFVYLCSNGIKMEESLRQFRPSPYLSWVVHLDGLAASHDRIAGRPGLFDTAIRAIAAAKRAGFQVRTNTTVYKGAGWSELQELFTLLTRLRVDGLMVAPAFSYERVTSDIFLTREEAAATLAPLYAARGRFRFCHSPAYLEFLAGRRALPCAPWSTPTCSVKGWRQPCYLITDGYCRSYAELMGQTPWAQYGAGNDSRCANCMVHSGFEASALEQTTQSPADLWRTMQWSLR